MALYNAEADIPACLPALLTFLEQGYDDYELIVVESGSTDRSGTLLDELAAAAPRLEVVHEGARNGFGSGLRLGLHRASKSDIMYVDVDIVRHVMPFIMRGAALLDDYDVVVGQRTGSRESLKRGLASAVYNRLMSAALGLSGIRDINFSFKLFRKTALDQLDLRASGWFIDAEILAEVRAKDLRLGQIEVPSPPHGDGDMSTVRVGRSTTLDILREMMEYRRRRAEAGRA